METGCLERQHRKGQEITLCRRVHPGSFLRTSTVSAALQAASDVLGCDRYFQLAKCFRDEDFVRTDSRNLHRSIWSCLS